MQPHCSTKAPRIPGLDGIRAISISLVVATHLTHRKFGSYGVQIFFVLSGFLITRLLLEGERKTGTIRLGGFYWRRGFRILPPVIMYLTVTAIVFRLGAKEVIACLFFFRNPASGSDVTGHFWSLAIEEQFYLIWPACLIMFGLKRIPVAAALFLFAPIWRNVSYHLAGGGAYVNPSRFDLRYDALLAGCLLALLLEEGGFLRRGLFQARSFALSGALVLVGIVSGYVVLPQFIAPTVANIVIASLINYAIHNPDPFLNSEPVVWIGQLSYSLYLWHAFFLYVPFLPLSLFPWNVAASIAVAALSFYFVEQKAINLRDRIIAQRNHVGKRLTI